MSYTTRLHSEEDTARLARHIAAHCEGVQTVGLCGDLGAGKTTLVRLLIAALGGAAEQVSSPSFTLQHEYCLPNGAVAEHWDLYRLRELPEELLEPPVHGALRVVEWPDRIAGYIDLLDLVISICVTESGAREVVISGPRAEDVFAGTDFSRSL